MATKRPTREPLSDQQLKELRADDLKRLHFTESEVARLRQINADRERERKETLKRVRAEQQLILKDLREAGLEIEALSDLSSTGVHNELAAPTLLRHLPLPYSDLTRETIARALASAVPSVRAAWSLLVDEYRNAPQGVGVRAPGDQIERQLRAKEGLACALSAAVTSET